MSNCRLMRGDCIEVMDVIPDNSIDLICCDLPFGTTRCKWDTIIPLEPLWKQYKRIIKTNGAIILHAQTPFDKVLGCSNLPMLRYEWVWEKTAATGHLNAGKMPMKAHENILVFYKTLPQYYPIKTTGHPPVHSYTKHQTDGDCYGRTKTGITGGGATDRYPRSVLRFPSDKQRNSLHPTQKPLALIQYLISTYTKEGDTVLDNCMGSGTTGEAAMSLSRRFIGIEKDEEYFNKAVKRIEALSLETGVLIAD